MNGWVVGICVTYLKYSLLNFKNGNVECSASQVIHGNTAENSNTRSNKQLNMHTRASLPLSFPSHLILSPVQPEWQCCSCWFIDDSQHIQSGYLSSVLRSLHQDTINRSYHSTCHLWKTSQQLNYWWLYDVIVSDVIVSDVIISDVIVSDVIIRMSLSVMSLSVMSLLRCQY